MAARLAAPDRWLSALSELLQAKPDARAVTFGDAIETSIRSNA